MLGCSLAAAGCASSQAPATAIAKPCVLSCLKSHDCEQLDARLLEARVPMLTCVGQRAERGDLVGAHRCYRSLRLLESARWWLKTLSGDDELHTVYRPSDPFKKEFLCRIEALSRAQTAAAVERLYMDMIRSFP